MISISKNCVIVTSASRLTSSSLMPSDRTGENPLWVSDEPFWDDFYTLCKLFLELNPDFLRLIL